MKKKLAILLCIMALVISIGAVTAQAEGFDPCPCCDKAYADCNWQEWTLTSGSTENALVADGHYYLTADIPKVTSQFRIGDDTATPSVTIDLRGHSITSSVRAFGVYPGSTLSIVDSVGGGQIKGRQISENQVGGVIRVNEGATFNLHGGEVLDVATTSHAANGAAISTEGKNVSINLYGGTVTGSAFAPNGGAIYAAKGATVTVAGSEINGGSAFNGGAIYLDNATLNVTGGIINGGTVTTENAEEGAVAGNGGAIYAGSASVVNISGGTVNGGTSVNGGAIAMMSSTLSMTGGNINGGAVSGHGSVIHLLADALTTEQKACTLEIRDGIITSKQNSSRAAITIASNAHTVTVTGGTITGAGKAGSGGAAISGQGTAATISIEGGTITGAANLSTERSGVIYSRGIVNISGGDIEVTAGDGPAVYMYQRYGLLTVSGDASTSLSGKVRLVDNAKAASGYGVLKLVNGITDGMWYYTCSNAMDNYPADAFLRLFGSNAKLNFKSNTVYLDLNGHTCTVTNGNFYGFDSANDSFNASKCGNVTVENTAQCLASTTTAPNGNQYITATAEDGTLSFHRFDIQLPYVYLRTALKKEGIFYGATVQMDQTAIDSLTTFGVALTTRELTTDAEWTENMDESVLRSTYELSELTASKINEVRSTSLINIININNNTMENTINAATMVYARPYLQLGNDFVYGDIDYCTMEQVAEWADDRWNYLVESQKTGLLGMYERFSGVMNGWDMPNLKAAYTSGDADVDAMILNYRRNLVLDAMRAQHEILWTVDKEVTFSITSTSSGVDADLAVQEAKGNKYNPLDDDIITFYPDRIYKSIPYTHGCGSNDAMAAFGTVDENGVYNLTDVNASLFNGGSTNGANATNGAYNVSRLGNDCWDMIHYAWGKLTNNVTAAQTRQMTPSFGVDIVGMDILENSLQENGVIAADGSLLDYICDKSTATATNGYYIYKNLPDTDAEGNTIAGNDVDGTRMIRYGTRTNIGTEASPVYDYQAIYQTYAMLQTGDAMVRWRNGSGHAMMVVSVNVVYSSDGSIDGEKSTITILEQGSGNEERQSRPESEFDATETANHSSHTSTNNNCMYCAGYTDEVIDGKHVWYLDLGEQERSFKAIVETDFIGVTCAALQEVSAPSKVRVAVSNGGSGVAGLYTGTLASTYRVTQVTLTITDANSQVASETTCVGIQSGVSGPFDLSRFSTDVNAGAYGSVLAGNSVLYQEKQTTTTENEDGTTTETTVTVQKADLPAGEYYYTYTCKLITGHTLTLRSGVFDVLEDGTVQ